MLGSIGIQRSLIQLGIEYFGHELGNQFFAGRLKNKIAFFSTAFRFYFVQERPPLRHARPLLVEPRLRRQRPPDHVGVPRQLDEDLIQPLRPLLRAFAGQTSFEDDMCLVGMEVTRLLG